MKKTILINSSNMNKLYITYYFSFHCIQGQKHFRALELSDVCIKSVHHLIDNKHLRPCLTRDKMLRTLRSLY